MSSNVNTIRKLKQNRKKRKRDVSRSKIEQTHDYLSKNVDPIISTCITHLLHSHPEDPAGEMLNFLKKRRLNHGEEEEVEKSRVEVMEEEDENLNKKRKTKRQDRLYLATTISPVLTKIMNRVVVSLPDQVEEFLIDELSEMVQNGEGHMIEEEDEVKQEDKGSTILLPQTPISSSPLPPLPSSLRIVVLGCGGAGKTSILYSLAGRDISKMRPTTGFRFRLLFSISKFISPYFLFGYFN